jgi:hypothetical protein
MAYLTTDTKPYVSSLLVLNIYRLEIHSVMLVFSTDFVNYWPFYLFSGYHSPPPPPPLPCVNKYSVKTSTMCRGGVGGIGVMGLGQIKHPPQSPYTGKFF